MPFLNLAIIKIFDIALDLGFETHADLPRLLKNVLDIHQVL